MPFHALSVFVDETGTYELQSDQTEFEEWDGFLAVYARDFDPERPLRNLVAVADDPPGSSRLVVQLVAGVIYRVVTAWAHPVPAGVTEKYSNRLTGPGVPALSACFPVGDEVDITDDGRDSVSLLDQTYCPTVYWYTDETGNPATGIPETPHIARLSPLRTDRSAAFWFFSPDNLELQVKALNGCSVNGYIWIFISATTNVGVVVDVVESGNLRQRTYQNEIGTPFEPILDTTAFSCDQLPASLSTR